MKLLLLRGILLSCQKSLRLLRRHWLPLYVCSRYLPTLVGGTTPAYSTLRCRRELEFPRLVSSLVRYYTLVHVSSPIHWYHELQI